VSKERIDQHLVQHSMEARNKRIPFMVRQAHHERNHPLSVRPEPVEGHCPFAPSLPKNVHLPFAPSLLKDVQFPSVPSLLKDVHSPSVSSLPKDVHFPSVPSLRRTSTSVRPEPVEGYPLTVHPEPAEGSCSVPAFRVGRTPLSFMVAGGNTDSGDGPARRREHPASPQAPRRGQSVFRERFLEPTTPFYGTRLTLHAA